MDLFFRKSGTGDPLIILHGLYGSSDNWYSIARELDNEHTIYLIDQRNHGNSPHHPEHNYPVLSHDLYEFMVNHHLDKSIIMGHSMGGKTALAFGLKYPEMVHKMIVVDISPLGYDKLSAGADHEKIILALQFVEPALIVSREDADKKLQRFITSLSVRQFLLKNLKRTTDGKFRWGLNIQVLAENMPAIFAGVIHENITDPRSIPQFPLLFIKGEYSGYITNRDEESIRHFFPWAELVVISKTGHWVHAEQPKAFLKAVNDFLGK
jgi:esterase